MIAIARAAGLGLGLGAATGIPLGVINLSVVEAATRGSRRHAIAIGVGGALADTVHAGLAFVGLAPALATRPDLLRALAVASAAIVIAYAVIVWRGRTRAIAPDRRGGVLVGLALTLTNPAPLAAWIAVASVLFPDASTAEGAAGALGVGVGSALWFALLAHLAARVRSSSLVTRWLPRVIAIAFAAIAIAAVVRAFS